MIAADVPIQRPTGARLLHVDSLGVIRSHPRAHFADLLERGDLVIANDAATLPASLRGVHCPTGRPVEVRLAGRGSLAPDDLIFQAVLFGAGDFHTRTEDRPPPPSLAPGDRLALGTLEAQIVRLLGHPRFVELTFDDAPGATWAGIARCGRPVQYSHVRMPLQVWDVWTPIAGLPVAFEAPSASFALDWRMLKDIKAAGAGFATITHAAGLSTTGDPALDARLPLPEPYRVSAAAVSAIDSARSRGGRIVAIGTTVVRALEHAARSGRLVPGEGVADQLIGPRTELAVIDVILSGAHEPGSSHYQLLRAFATDATLARADKQLDAEAFHNHEFGDSVMIERHKRLGITQSPRWHVA